MYVVGMQVNLLHTMTVAFWDFPLGAGRWFLFVSCSLWLPLKDFLSVASPPWLTCLRQVQEPGREVLLETLTCILWKRARRVDISLVLVHAAEEGEAHWFGVPHRGIGD